VEIKLAEVQPTLMGSKTAYFSQSVTDHRLYQLVRQKGAVTDHVFAIEFEDPGVQAFSFTFG